MRDMKCPSKKHKNDPRYEKTSMKCPQTRDRGEKKKKEYKERKNERHEMPFQKAQE